MAKIILTPRIAKKGVRRLRDEIERRTGERLRYSANWRTLQNPEHTLAFRYGYSIALLGDIAHKETVFNSPADLSFMMSKKKFCDRVRELGFLAPDLNRVRDKPPTSEDFPIILRTTLSGYGGDGMFVYRTPEEFEDMNHTVFNTSFWWCPYIQTRKEFRFHIGNPKGGLVDSGPMVLRSMEKVPRTEEIASRDIHIRHCKEYFYSKRLDPEEKFPLWCKQLKELALELPGWLYSIDVGVTKGKRMVLFEANSASGIDNGCARDYADFLIPELGLGG